MIFTYNGYSHDEYSVTVDINIRGLENPTGYVYGDTVTLTVTGILQADTLSELLTKQAALQTVYKVQNGNVSWKSGSTTIYEIISENTLYGVRVVTPPTFAQGAAPGELVNRRRYTITLEAAYTYAATSAETPYVLNYESNLSFTGLAARRSDICRRLPESSRNSNSQKRALSPASSPADASD